MSDMREIFWRILSSEAMNAAMLFYATIVLLACGWDALTKHSPWMGGFAMVASAYVIRTMLRLYHQ
ncbi:MAG TPA: hypothetical protein VE222_07480 [Nitrospiraceae bacterium]|nr:hypothetical protein [Nitrospiraceae bacterium]